MANVQVGLPNLCTISMKADTKQIKKTFGGSKSTKLELKPESMISTSSIPSPEVPKDILEEFHIEHGYRILSTTKFLTFTTVGTSIVIETPHRQTHLELGVPMIYKDAYPIRIEYDRYKADLNPDQTDSLLQQVLPQSTPQLSITKTRMVIDSFCDQYSNLLSQLMGVTSVFVCPIKGIHTFWYLELSKNKV